MNTKTTKTRKTTTTSSLKTNFLFFIAFLFCSSAFAQDQFVWTGNALDGKWTTAGNWDYYPYGGATHGTATVFPGQVSPKNDIAIFINNGAPDCFMDKDCSTAPTALRVGGIIIKDYTGIITQINSNRFNVSAVTDPGGDELPDFTVTVQTTDPTMPIDIVGMSAWQAYFEFGGTALPSNGFQGNPAIPGPLDYTLLFAVPVRLVTGTFKAPKDETWVRHDMFVQPAAAPHFNNVYEGAVVLDNTNHGGSTRNYVLGGVNFWDLRIGTSGGVTTGAIKEFSGGTCTVENDLTTGGIFGVSGVSASDALIMNAPAGTEIHIKKDLIVGNKHFTVGSMVYAAANAYGDLFLVMNGSSTLQRIFHIESAQNFSGCLPSLRINKPVGSVVELHGPTTVNNQLELVSGLVIPAGLGNNQSDLGISNNLFVINSNTTVSSTDISYCTGAIRARTGKTLELPVGKSVYRPAIIRPISGVGADNSQINLYTAEYFEAPISAATPPSSFDSPTLDLMTDCEMWAIDKADDTGSDSWTFNLELSYDLSSCSSSLIYDDICKIAVSRWDESELKWKSHGNDGVFPTASNGDATIRTSLAVVVPDFERSLPTSSTTPDLFTFGRLSASACVADPCEVHVCVDYCQEEEFVKFDPNIVLGPGSIFDGIFWDFGDGGTSTDINPIHEYMSDGVHMVTVTVSAIKDGVNCTTTYTFGIFYNSCTLPVMEMIRQNNNNQTKDSKAVNTLQTDENNSNLKIAPNPSSTGTVQFSLETKEKGNFDYVITNNLGQTILTGIITGNENKTINTSKLAAGSYIMSVQLLDKKITQQFMVIK